jgi:hypothetical protein
MKMATFVALLLATTLAGVAQMWTGVDTTAGPSQTHIAAAAQTVALSPSERAFLASLQDPADSKTFVCKCSAGTPKETKTTCNKGDSCDCRSGSAKCVPPKKD